MFPTSTGLMPFAFEESLVRIRQDAQGVSWFVAKDVCSVLDLTNVTEAIRALEDDEKITLSNSEGNPREGVPHSLNLISESGLYSLIFRSRKPEARTFRKWVTGEVLPALRKQGSYGAPMPEIDYAALARLPLSLKKTVLTTATKELGQLSQVHKDMASRFAADVLYLSAALAPQALEMDDGEEPECVRLFWQAFARLNADDAFNHSRNADLIALRLTDVLPLLRDEGFPFTLTELRDALPKGRQYRCIGTSRTVNSSLLGKTVRCTVFSRQLSAATAEGGE